MQDSRKLTSPPAKCERATGVSDMSLWRWLRQPRARFPAPIKIHKRRYWRLADLETWEASRALGAAPEAAAEPFFINIQTQRRGGQAKKERRPDWTIESGVKERHSTQ